MSFLSTVQTVAKNYDEVSTKINQLIAENGILDANDIEDLEIVPFGAGMFLCTLLFNQFLRWIKYVTPMGLKVDAVTKYSTRRPILPILGLVIVSLKEKYKVIRIITTPIGLKVFSPLKGVKRIAKLGLKASYGRWGRGKLKGTLLGAKIIGKTVKLNNATVTWP